MARLLLSESDDWHLKFPDDQDVRGFRVLDAQRNETGNTVRDMVIDTDEEMVSHLVFSDGTEYPASDLSIGDGVVYATTDTMDDARRSSDMEDYGRVRRRSDADAYNDPLAAGSLMGDDATTGSSMSGSSMGSGMSSGSTGGSMSGSSMGSGSMSGGSSMGTSSMDAAALGGGAMTGASAGSGMSGGGMGSAMDDDSAYQSHFGSMYGHTGRAYDTYRPAYDYGRQARSQYGDRDFSEVESSMRGDYESRYGQDADSAWDNVKDAVRHAYDRAKRAVS